MNEIEEKVRRTIESRNLMSRGDKVIVALSGGADSVCLTHALYTLKDRLGITLMTAHLNHGIRGAEADADEEYAREFSQSLGISCVIERADIPTAAKASGLSEETAGRRARYDFFERILESRGFDKIATAHNLNDSAETAIMNFMRGSSLAGLSGIPYKRGRIIRPLLDVSRTEIEEYCDSHHLKFVTDKTNLLNKYTRNKIRNELIPLIEREFNPNFIKTVTRNAAVISGEEDYIKTAAEEEFRKIVKDGAADIKTLLKCHGAIARRVIRGMSENELSAEFVEKIMALAKNGKTGSRIVLPDGETARIEYGRLIIGQGKITEEYEYPLPIGAEVYVKEAGVTILAEYAERRESDGAQYFSRTSELSVRSRKSGDYFCPEGMTGKKKLKDYFIDEKVPRGERDSVPIIVSGGDIVYIVGKRRDRRFKFNGQGIKITVKTTAENI